MIVYEYDNETRHATIHRFLQWVNEDDTVDGPDCTWSAQRRVFLSLGEGMPIEDENSSYFEKVASILTILTVAEDFTGLDKQVMFTSAVTAAKTLIGILLHEDGKLDAQFHHMYHSVVQDYADQRENYIKLHNDGLRSVKTPVQMPDGSTLSMRTYMDNYSSDAPKLPQEVIDRIKAQDYDDHKMRPLSSQRYTILEQLRHQYPADEDFIMQGVQIFAKDEGEEDNGGSMVIKKCMEIDPNFPQYITDCIMANGCAYVALEGGRITLNGYPPTMSPQLRKYLKSKITRQVSTVEGQVYVIDAVQRQLQAMSDGTYTVDSVQQIAEEEAERLRLKFDR